MATHLVIGDPHCTPGTSNERFLLAGRLAKDIKATHVICMGDFCSVDSLSSYDKGKMSFEGKRFNKDVEHTEDALAKFSDTEIVNFMAMYNEVVGTYFPERIKKCSLY